MSLPHPLRSHRLALIRAATIGLAGCAMPSDQTDQVVVTIEAPTGLLVRGRTMVLSAHAYQPAEGGGTTELPGVVFRWNTSTPDLVTLEERPDGTALVTPVNEGTADIEAFAPA